MPLDKSPGPDGYSTEFFKAAWPVLGLDLLAAIRSFFDKGFLPKGINSTILALIPKKESASKIQDYRPISCCNVLYKIISKILADRLKLLLPRLVSKNQSAFIKGRLLMENVLLASELVKDYHLENVSPRSAMMIDIAKAFDTVQWDFLLNTLLAHQFPEKFVHWIKLCITTPSFSVQVNGELAGYFGSSRGLRQGCPLSPYLFVMCMNVLSNSLDMAASSRIFNYHPKCKTQKLTHLCFADDIMVFTQGNYQSMEGVLQVFANFTRMSGLTANLEKSTIFGAGIKQDILHAITATYKINLGTLPVRYLGLPLLTRRMQVQDYTPLVHRIKSKLSSWTGRFLSYAGRLQLINSVISGIINFWISVFRLPKRCITEINGLCSAFLWSGPVLSTNNAKVSWVEACKPKKEGGLGIMNINESNKVCTLKLIWRVLSQKTLWSDWITANLYRTPSFWSLSRTSSGSWIWRKLLRLRNLAKTFHRIELGNGKKASFWFDLWSSLGRLNDQTISQEHIHLDIPLKSSVHDASCNHRRRQYRNIQLSNIMQAAYQTFDSLRPLVEDKDLWKSKEGTYKGFFNSHNTWKLIREESPRVPWFSAIWFPFSTPKYSFITWLATRDRLATGDRVSTWISGIHSRCTFCDCSPETRDHLFLACNFSTEVWKTLLGFLTINNVPTSWDVSLQMLTNGGDSASQTFLLRYTFQSTIYHLWRERNLRRHGTNRSSSSLLVKLIDQNVRDRLSSIQTQNEELHASAVNKWSAH